MIIFGSILTTFESSSIFRDNWAVLKIIFNIKPNHHRKILLAQIRETLSRIDSLLTLTDVRNCSHPCGNSSRCPPRYRSTTRRSSHGISVASRCIDVSCTRCRRLEKRKNQIETIDLKPIISLLSDFCCLHVCYT